MSLRAVLPSADDLAEESATAWGQTYLVREMGADAASDYFEEVAAEKARVGKAPSGPFCASRLLARTLRDPASGALVFDTPEAVADLAGRSNRSLIRLVGIANRVCGFGDAEGKKTEGESTAVPSSASSSN